MNQVSSWLESFKKSKKRSKVIAFVSGKGGVGKTTCTLKVAKELSQRNKKVLIIDCDYNLSNTAVKLGIPNQNKFLEYIKGKRDISNVVSKLSCFDLISTLSGDLDAFDGTVRIQQIIIELVEYYQSQYDYILLDCSGGISKETLNIASFCDYRLVVLTSDKSSLTDAYSLTKVLLQRYGLKDNFFIINKCPDMRSYEQVMKALSSTSNRFLSYMPTFLGHFPYHDIDFRNFDQDFIFGENFSIQQASHQIIEKLIDRTIRVSFDSNEQISQGTMDSYFNTNTFQGSI